MSWIEDYAQGIIGKMPTYGDFSKLFPWESFYDPQLARAGAMQRSEGYYLPILEKNIDSIRNQMVQRNLFRSGIRNYNEQQQMTDIADAQAQMAESLTAQREKEMRDRYALLQSQYEENPTGYTPPQDLINSTQQQSKPTDYYGYRQAMYGNKPTVGYRYGIGTEEGSPYKYGQSYKQWWENKFKKSY